MIPEFIQALDLHEANLTLFIATLIIGGIVFFISMWIATNKNKFYPIFIGMTLMFIIVFVPIFLIVLPENHYIEKSQIDSIKSLNCNQIKQVFQAMLNDEINPEKTIRDKLNEAKQARC
jgi:ABC-type spermidine/putrescine transport system permease subunit II